MTGSRIKVVILGGSALATPMVFDAMGQLKASRAYDFVMVGRDEERLNLVKAVSDEIIQSYPLLDINTAISTNIEGSLPGMDYCINQVRIGGLEGRAFDETFPRQFGIPGEETVGPGGFTNSMRGIPFTLEICRMIELQAPNATLLNLTNPSSIVHYAVHRYTNVQVVGTCDSPISLTSMVAGLLNLPVEEVEFDLGGMHHFGWITGVKHDGKEYLPELLERADKMPKLGTDPEVIRAFGAIPTYYFKYYFHPDRMLAATEGRPIRAHQLMELSGQILEAYRAWRPGTPPDMLKQRGAVWYDKIVVPTLLALAEKQTTELILSIDNHDSFDWLPKDAIIEGRVPVQDGKLGAVRSFDPPQDVKAMMSQNCAYETLAAQAIVEQDRDKALRALMANLLVSDFNQARGILNQVWPGEDKATFQSIDMREPEPGAEAFKVPTLYYGDDLVEKLRLPEEDYALITMQEPWEIFKDRAQHEPACVFFVNELDWYRLEALERQLPEVGAILALGGGTATDAAKYLAWRRHLPVDAFPSITSVDAAVTKSIAARSGGHVTYIGYIVPRNVYIDYPLIQGAPRRLNISGVGDIICSYTALWDWRLAYEHKGEAYDPDAVKAMEEWLDRILAGADEIRAVSKHGIQLIMQAFEDISLICRRFGSSRPQEASDHTFAYNAEFQTGKHFLHGELVALGSYVMTCLQGNDTTYLTDVYDKTGLLWQPRDVGITRDEFTKTLSTLNWYQKSFGRRYSILDEVTIEPEFTNKILDELQF
jgi:6-phospho-beta-glucosidase